MIAITVSIALALDWLLGEPHRFHPLVGFGSLAQSLERHLHGNSILRGAISVLLLLVPFTLFAMLMDRLIGGVALDALLLYLALGWTSLGEHAGRVRAALLGDDLPLARQRVGLIVSRDTSGLDEEGVARATVESVLENGNDAVFGALFWFVVAGAPGVVLYRLSNTLDAMWGYRNARYNKFGWAAARLDDVLNYIPARLTAASYALVGHTRSALRCWRQQAPMWDSPNAGPVMAAGAGALQVRLGGAAIYHGQLEQRPALGCGMTAGAADIARAVRLMRHTLYLWLAVIAVGAWLIAGWQHA